MAARAPPPHDERRHAVRQQPAEVEAERAVEGLVGRRKVVDAALEDLDVWERRGALARHRARVRLELDERHGAVSAHVRDQQAEVPAARAKLDHARASANLVDDGERVRGEARNLLPLARGARGVEITRRRVERAALERRQRGGGGGRSVLSDDERRTAAVDEAERGGALVGLALVDDHLCGGNRAIPWQHALLSA